MAWRRREGRGAAGVESAWRRSLRAAVAEDWDAAETWLERVVEADSSDLDAYHALARLYRRQGSIGRAIRMHQNLLLRGDLESDARAEALLELARDFDAGGFAQRAIASYEEFLGRRPRHAEAIERLIRLHQSERDHARALALVRRLRRRDRERANALEVEILLAQAQARHDAGDADAARQALKKCLRRDRSCGAAWAMLGELEAERDKSARALDAWKRGAVADRALAPVLYPKIAATFAARGKAEDYERFLNDVLERRPDDHAARIALARAIASRGEAGSAVEELARAIEVAPDDLGLRAEIGRQLLDAGLEAEALKAYADLVERLARSEEDATGEATP